MNPKAVLRFFQPAVVLAVVASLVGANKAESAEPLPQVLMKTTKGDMVIELYEDEAPNTVANFIDLVERKFYNGLFFHRVIDGAMAQGGDPTGTGTGGPGYAIDCECDLPGARMHQKGSLSMAHAGKNTGGSQFFVVFDGSTTKSLNRKHTVFGQVIQGIEVLDKIERGAPGSGAVDKSKADKIIEATVIQKRNHEYAPKTHPSSR